MSLEVLLGKVLQVTLAEGDVNFDVDFLLVTGDLDGLAEVSSFSLDLDALTQVLCEVAGVEDLVLHGLRTVEHEGAGDLGLLLLDLLLSLLHLNLLCGHLIFILY